MDSPCPLDRGLDRSSFGCGEPVLNDYLKKFARQTQDRDGAKTSVVLAQNQVIGYYTLVLGSVEWDHCPEVVRKVLGKYPLPVLVIARLVSGCIDVGCGLRSLVKLDRYRYEFVINKAKPISV